MGIEDIQISEELETNAPSIKYRGDEGPKSPQEIEQMMMAQLEEEYLKYVDEMMEMGREPMSMQQFMEQAMAEGQMAGGNPLPQDPTKPVNPFQPKPTGPVLPDRQMAAYGGIMGMDGRRRYGIGSKLKKFVRKVIPNEVAEIAVKAAPFVAPFNPLAAGLMSGIGSFDQTGRIGSSLKSGLINYGLGNVSRMLGGAGFQGGLKSKAMAGQTGLGSYFTSPTSGARLFGGTPKANVSNTIPVDNKQMAGKNYTIDNATGEVVMRPEEGLYSVSGDLDAQAALTDKALKNVKLASQDSPLANLKSKIMEYVPTSLGDLNPLGENFDIKKAVGAFGIYKTAEALLGGPDDVEDQIMDLGGMEKDYRAEGGFVPIGREEKADDVPARLSVNEFVFTADAVRNAGGGDIDKGAEVMENMMKNLEAGGQVSEESQGMQGAQQMFETSERLSEVI